jgi:maltooligosyltrehalose trehalohydrolase
VQIQSNSPSPTPIARALKSADTPVPVDKSGEITETWTFQYDARGLGGKITDLHLKGSFNPETGAYDPNWNGGRAVDMVDNGKDGDARPGDGVYTARVTLKGKPGQEFEWGAASGDGRWAVLQEKPLKIKLGDKPVASYAPVSNHLYGVHQDEGGVRFQTWAPAMGKDGLANYGLNVDLYNQQGEFEKSIPMTKDEASGNWTLSLPGQWEQMQGKSYLYSARDGQGNLLKTQSGKPVVYADPYSRYLMGQQRGLEKIFVDPVLGFETGWYDDSGKGGPNYADNPTFGRFTVDNHGDAQKVQLVLRDQQDHQLTKAELLERLGEPTFPSYDQARPADKRDVDVLKAWSLADSPKINSYLWTNKVNDDGSIEMTRVDTNRTGTGWTTVVNNFPNLEGLKYEFQVFKDGKMVGDLNGDGKLSAAERAKTPFNDAYDNTISARPGSARRSLIKESSYVFRYNDTPRKETDFRKKVIFELHVGSFLAPKDNAVPPTAEDLVNNLDYLEEMGVTDLYMMPTSEFGGKRDWGYTTDYFFAGADAYGFEMKRDQAVADGLIKPDQARDQESVWIGGTDAIKWLNDQAHKRGFSTMGDVVYNHTSGKTDGDNPLWQIDGDANSFFANGGETPWGKKPAYREQGVSDFFSNNATQQLTEMGFDNLRFDFVQVLHNTGSVEEQVAGMNTLRQIHRTLQTVKPGTVTVAEDFSRNWLVAAGLEAHENQGGIEKKGMGFQAVWNDGAREGIYKGVEGSDNVDHLMDAMLNHYGVSGWDRAVLYAHSHDEVGNSGKWVGRAAAHSKEVMGNYARAAARSGAALTLTGPGMPMMWQGEEFLANNDFKHGLTSTWGYDTDWLNFKVTPDRLEVFKSGNRAALKPGEEKYFERYQQMNDEQKAQAEICSLRAGQFHVYQDLIKLRRSSDSFSATAPINRVTTNNQDRVIAYSRGDNFVVATNLSDQNRSGYSLNLPPGQWKEVLNTNAQEYGGTGAGNFGVTVQGNQGVMLPAGSTIVFKKVG